MKWLELSVTFDESQTVSLTDVVAAIFFDLGLNGVTVETPWSEGRIDWAPDAPPPAVRCAVIGYIPVDPETGQKCNSLRAALVKLACDNSIQTQLTYRRLDQEDWSDAWKTYFAPTRVTQRLVVKPTWHKFVPQTKDLVIEIDPGMAFGTGTHPTTRLCLQLIETYLQLEMTLVDVGTGSGILLIAGALLGASKGLGLDTDPVAVEVATQNLAINGIDSQRFKIRRGTWGQAWEAPYDMVAANILTGVIVDLIPDLTSLLSPQGFFICSGIIRKDHDVVIAALHSNGLKPIATRNEETWVAFAARWR